MNDTNAGQTAFSRREALKTLGAGAALLGLGLISTESRANEPAASASAALPASTAAADTGLSQPFVLPKLGYAFDALEPHIDARTMEIHYTKHHQAYITNANKALADHPELRALTAEEILHKLPSIPKKNQTALRNNVGGHVNHSFFWKVIGPNGGGSPGPALSEAIVRTFGSFDLFKSQFSDAAAKRFGSGWAWLTFKKGTLAVTSTANQDSPLIENATPLLGLDVWEHAYYLHYQNRRPEYVAAFWKVINWPQVDANYAAALKA